MTFDWTTFALQLVNVLVLLAILRHFLFRPVAAIIAKRRAETQAALDAANTARAEAEAATARAHTEAEASAAARAGVLEKAEADAEEQRRKLLASAHAEAERIIAEGRAALTRDEAAATARRMAQLRELAAAVATRALAAQPAGPQGYADRLAATLRAMTDSERAALLKGGNLQLVSPDDVPAATLKAAQDALSNYGATAQLTQDPDLIAGLELRSDSGVLRNSLAHDLDQISSAMQDDRASA